MHTMGDPEKAGEGVPDLAEGSGQRKYTNIELRTAEFQNIFRIR